MSKPKINVQAIIEKSRITHNELKEAIPKVKFTKEEKQEIIKDVEEAIALAESIKTNIQKEKAKRA